MMFRIFTICLFCLGYHTADGQKAIHQPIQVAIYNAPPFGFESKNGTKAGLMVEMWEAIADEMEWSYDYHLTDMDGLLSGLQNKQFDVGLGAISITPKREQLVDFSQPVNPSGTGIAVAANSKQNNFQTYYKPILTSLAKLIGLLALVLLVSGTLVWWVERRQINQPPSDKNIKAFHDALWWSAVTMTTVGYGDKVPTSVFGKILGIVWIFTSVILLSLFTANASAIFSSAKAASPIQNVNDLRNARVVAATKSSGEEFLIREQIAYQPYPDIEKAIEAVIAGKADCVVSNVPFLMFYNNSTFKGQLSIATQWLLKNNMGIALQDESPIKEDIDRILLQKIAEPKWQQAVYKYFGSQSITN